LQSLKRIDDSFQKIVIVGDYSPRYQNEDGIMFMDVYDCQPTLCVKQNEH